MTAYGGALPELQRRVKALREDDTVQGVLLNGSWAVGCATPQSDLDLLALCGEDRFTAEWAEGLPVETHRVTMQTAREKLSRNPMEVYRYLEAEIQFDRGGLAELIQLAEEIYEAYRTPEPERRRLAHWMASVELKLRAAIQMQDRLRQNYIASTNAWPFLEAVWAVNNRPMPPASTVFRLQNMLAHVPFEGWFEALFLHDIQAALACFVWAKEQLNSR